MMHKVFVYGSLKKGFGNHSLLTDSHYLGPYPGVVSGEGIIHGELYEVDDTTFSRLDRLEGYPSFYGREETPINIGEDQVIAWMYTLPDTWHTGSRVIESGVWL
jgi:gamma-glutamylcyclotransferase (GGCT)/AIG2-like uncharacterized protein YtfP